MSISNSAVSPSRLIALSSSCTSLTKLNPNMRQIIVTILLGVFISSSNFPPSDSLSLNFPSISRSVQQKADEPFTVNLKTEQSDLTQYSDGTQHVRLTFSLDWNISKADTDLLPTHSFTISVLNNSPSSAETGSSSDAANHSPTMITGGEGHSPFVETRDSQNKTEMPPTGDKETAATASTDVQGDADLFSAIIPESMKHQLEDLIELDLSKSPVREETFEKITRAMEDEVAQMEEIVKAAEDSPERFAIEELIELDLTRPRTEEGSISPPAKISSNASAEEHPEDVPADEKKVEYEPEAAINDDLARLINVNVNARVNVSKENITYAVHTLSNYKPIAGAVGEVIVSTNGKRNSW